MLGRLRRHATTFQMSGVTTSQNTHAFGMSIPKIWVGSAVVGGNGRATRDHILAACSVSSERLSRMMRLVAVGCVVMVDVRRRAIAAQDAGLIPSQKHAVFGISTPKSAILGG
jgi:hypothetical protein